MTKIVCISDTHNRNAVTIPPCDILIHAGDATMMGRTKELRSFFKWFGGNQISAKHRVFVPGNHDWMFQDDEESALSMAERFSDNPVTILNQETVTLCGLNIYGEPRQPWFYDWAFNVQPEDMEAVWCKVPTDTNILVSHGPPHMVGDTTKSGDSVGCKFLRRKVLELEQLKLVVCGHIHRGYGVYQLGEVGVVNASICNEAYEPQNKPIVFSISD